MSDKRNTDELWKRYLITQEVFERPIEMTRHEDEKAGRILASIAFLTAAAAAVFSALLNKGLKLEFSLSCSLRIDLIPVCFAVYIVFVVFGTILMLEAFGPSLELPKVWRKSVRSEEAGSEETFEPQSILFFEKISEEDRNQWISYFDSRTVKDILTKACNDHVFEAHLVSTKVRKKVRRIKWGKRFFYLAMVMFAALVLVGCYAYAIV